MDNVTASFETTAAMVTKSSPALLPGWPNCAESLTPLPPGVVSHVKDWIATYVPPFIVVFGLFGNILTIIILIRSIKAKIPSTTLYLLLLAISDSVLILNGPLRQWLRLSWKYDFRSYHVAVCKIAVWLTYGTMQFSSWLLVALTLERVVSVLWPHKVRTSCTTTTSRIMCGTMFACIFTMNAHFLYGLGDTTLPYYTSKTCMPMHEDYHFFFLHVYHWINFVMTFAAPFVILAVGNCIIIFQITKSYSQRKQMGVTGSSKEKKTITRLMILLNVIFFISQTPMSIYLIYIPYRFEEVNQFACSDYPEYTRQAEVIWLLYTVVNMLGYINASINFVLYVISGAKFREEMKALLLCRRSPTSGSLFDHSTSVMRRSTRKPNNQVVRTVSKRAND